MAGETILIVEDERAVARGLQIGLEREGFAVQWADTGARALEIARREIVHLILLDIRLPDTSGFDVCRQLRAAGLRMPIVMVTARDEEVDRVLGLELGADDYVVKPYSLRELISRVRAHLRRAYGDLATPSSATLLRLGELELDLDRMQVRRKGQPIDLTPIEFRLLRVLALHAGRPISREHLIEAVWGYTDDVGSDRTVDAHVSHLRRKLGDDPTDPHWIVTVRGAGYKLEP